MRERVITTTGIVIGGAYTPPPAEIGIEAERIQTLLLKKPRDPDWTVVKGCAVIVAALVGALWGAE